MPRDNYTQQNVLRAVINTPWLITEVKMSQILGFLNMRAMGYTPSQEEITAMMAAAPTGLQVFSDNEGNVRDVNGTRLLRLNGVMAPKMNLMAQMSGGTSTEKLRAMVNDARADSEVKRVLLLVDSPGGVAPMTRELSDAIFELRKEKPVTTFSNVEMNSAAFWAGTAGTEVVASPSSTNGNVGVFHVLKESTKKNESEGETFTVLREGGLKGSGNEFEELTPERRDSIQGHLTSIMSDFVSGVSRNLGVSEATVRNDFGDGASFLAEEARDRGMVHRVATLEEVVDEVTSRTTAAPGGLRTPIRGEGGRGMLTERIRSALYACEVIDDPQASDSMCLTAIKMLAKVSNFQLSESTPESEIIDLITGKKASDDKAKTADARAAEEAKRQRVDEITQIGQLLGMPSEAVISAIDSDKTVDQVRKQWKEELSQNNTGVNTLTPGLDSNDKIQTAVVNSCLERMGRFDCVDDGIAYASSFRYMTCMDMVAQTLDAYNIPRTGDPRRDALTWLSLGCRARHEASADRIGEPTAYSGNGLPSTYPHMSEPSYNRQGDHPDALSNLMGKILEDVYGKMQPTYLAWTRRLPDVPNFKEQEIIDAGTFHELDVMLEDEKYPQLKFSTQLRAYFRAFKHGGKAGLTVEMVTNDDLSVFNNQLQDMALAPIQTVDRTSRNLLASNPTMFEDDTPMFDAAHGNIVASGGAPDAAQGSEMRRLLRLIRGFDADIAANEVAAGVIVPAKHENAAIQTFTPLAGQPENKVPVTDATLNTVRGLTVTTDADLDRYSEDEWYVVGREQLKPIGVGYVRGFGGPGGMRSTWVDPDTGTRWAAILVAFAISAIQWRGIIKNPGV